MATTRPRLLLADDHQVMAEGLGSLLSPEFEVIGVVADGRALVQQARELRPDLIVADISMPRLDGIEALVQLRREKLPLKVVFLTMHHDVQFARRALEAGAAGYVLKQSAAEELVLALRSALEGRTFVAPAIAGELLAARRAAGPAGRAETRTLTGRQQQILGLLVEGKSAKQIGAALEISPRTVEFHKYQMMASLRVQTSAELVCLAVRRGLVAPAR